MLYSQYQDHTLRTSAMDYSKFKDDKELLRSFLKLLILLADPALKDYYIRILDWEYDKASTFLTINFRVSIKIFKKS